MAFTGHNLIVGMTGSGKSTLAKIIISQATKANKETGVLDPLGDPTYGATFQTTNSEQFLAWAKANKSKLLFLDEAGASIGRFNKPMNWLATTSRHYGHLSFFLTWNATDLSPLIRGQCSTVYLFACSQPNIDLIALEWRKPQLKTIPELQQGEFVIVPRFGEIRKARIDFAKRSIYYDKLS